MPKCPWHFVKHLVCMASFDMFLSLHCDLAPWIILACPLGFQLLLTWVCYLPASTATSSMLWHFVEHTQCMHWTRPECAYCTMPRPSRHAGPPGFGPHGSTSPRTPLLAASRQATLTRYSAAARAFLAAHRRLQRASATVGAAKATPACHLPLE